MVEFRIEQSGSPVAGVAGPVPGLRIQGYYRGRTDESTNSRDPPKYIASGISMNVSIGSVSIPFVTNESGFRYGSLVRDLFDHDLKCLIHLPRYLLDAIEKQREHDLKISVTVELRYFVPGEAPNEMLQMIQGSMKLDVSQKQWLDALAQMGYAGGWVLEVERPDVEGWPKAVEFLERAAERIASGDPQEALHLCRVAWDVVEPLLEAYKIDINAEIDRGSKEEEREPSKSMRIETLRKDTKKWTHTGAHPESYFASMDDAQLAYRLTASLMSYLSRKATKAGARVLE